MPKSVFVSYNHRQGQWVFDRLIPCLKAAGVEYFADEERFKAGKPLGSTITQWQDKADINLLVFSPEYLQSKYCNQEYKYALKRDPTFSRGMVLPIMRVGCILPTQFLKANPIYVDMTSDQEAEPWRKLLDACEATLATCPLEWLKARDRTRLHLKRNESVNLVVQGGASWRELVDHLRGDNVNQMGLVNLEDPATFSRRGLVQAILRATGSTQSAPDEPDDLAVLGRVIESRSSTRIALTHFDRVATREYTNKVDLFSAIRFWLMDSRKLVLLVQSRAPFNSLVPNDHPLSPISLRTVELREHE